MNVGSHHDHETKTTNHVKGIKLQLLKRLMLLRGRSSLATVSQTVTSEFNHVLVLIHDDLHLDLRALSISDEDKIKPPPVLGHVYSGTSEEMAGCLMDANVFRVRLHEAIARLEAYVPPVNTDA